MGFFSTPEEIAAREAAAKPKGPTTAKKKLAIVAAGARGCDACVVKQTWGKLASPKMSVFGNTKNPDILVIGEFPDDQADKEGKPLAGDWEKLLLQALPSRHKHRLVFQNVVRCRTDSKPTPAVAHACSIHLEEDINRFPIKAVIGLGSLPLSRVFPGQSITMIHGLRMPAKIGNKMVWFYPVTHPDTVLSQGGDRSPIWPILKNDLKRFFEHVDEWGKPEIANISTSDVILPENEEDAEALLDAMEDPIAIDLETTSLSSMEVGVHLLTAGISDGEYTIAFPVDHPNAPNAWGRRILAKAIQRRWIAHNAAMELRWLLHFFPDVQLGPFDDTQALARNVYERESAGGLDVVSRLTCGVNVKALSDLDVRNLVKYPVEEVLVYNGLDALGTRLAYNKLIKRVNKSNYQRMLGGILATTHTELLPLTVDFVIAQNLKEKWSAKQKAAIETARKIYEVKQFEAANLRPFNIASNDDVGEALVVYGKLHLPPMKQRGERKVWSTTEADLKQTGPDNPLVSCVINHREASKIQSTYIDPALATRTRYVDSGLHPKYTILLTRTGRTSSEDPNAQNWPKHDTEQKEVRRQVVPKKGHVFVALDYGQIEARIIACASRDRNFIRILLEGYDVHAHWRDEALELYPNWIDVVADRTGEAEAKALMKAARDLIKNRFVFQHFFGGSVKGAVEATGIPLQYMEQLSSKFWNTFRGVKEWIKQRRREYADSGTSRTLTGRVRYGVLPGNEPINNPIQGTAADVFLDAINDLSVLAVKNKDPYLQPRIAIHDDLIFELPDDERMVEYIDVIQETMVKVRYNWQVVPFIAEARVGENWCDLHDFAVFHGDYVR